jgi:glyoxylase-like metal-dependent hydrolase (beta-lactamase superfamily II)
MDQKAYRIEKLLPGLWHINEASLDAMYLIEGAEKALLIDTGTGVGDLKGLVESLTNKPYDVVLTHGHVDHAGGINQFKNIFVHPDDIERTRSVTVKDRQEYFRKMSALGLVNTERAVIEGIWDIPDKPVLSPISEGDIIDLGETRLEVFHTPGHTDGSICLLDRKDKVLFSGDSLNGLIVLYAHILGFSDSLEEKKAVLKRWHEKAVKRMLKLSDKYDFLCAGHALADHQQIKDLDTAALLYMEGKISMNLLKVHIYYRPFINYKNIFISTCDENYPAS